MISMILSTHKYDAIFHTTRTRWALTDSNKSVPLISTSAPSS